MLLIKNRLLLALWAFFVHVMIASTSYGQGRNEILKNPTPDRTWSTQVGGWFSSGKSYAVVVSISDYIGSQKGGFRELKTHNDSAKMVDFLLKDLGFDYIHVLTDREVTKENIDKVMLDEIRPLVGINDRFLFYWSGHGTQLVRADNKTVYGFLPLFNSKVTQFSSMVSMDDITRWNNYLAARHALFLLDACLSGLAGVNPKSDPRWDQMTLPARFLITAGAANEEAIAGDLWSGSLFTSALIALTKDYNTTVQGPISIYRLFDDLRQRVAIEKQRAGRREPLTPQLKDLGGGGGAFFFSTGRIREQEGAEPPVNPISNDVATKNSNTAISAPSRVLMKPSVNFDNIDILYWTKIADEGRVINALRFLNVKYRTKEGMFDLETNIIVCTPDVPVAAVKELALALVDAGVSIRSVTTNSDQPGKMKISVESIHSLEEAPVLKRQDIQKMTSCALNPKDVMIIPNSR
jgi:hypothetical protein